MIHITVKSKLYAIAGDVQPHWVINDFRLNLKDNEFVCLVGPSGCGKTTLLNLVAGLDDDFDGEIRFDERQDSPTIGYVFQNPRLLPWRTVRENIELALNDHSPSGTIDNLLEIMQLADFQHVYPERLSLGMSRRVAIIRAFAINPNLLLMDEPFVSLDGATAQQVRSLLIGLWEQRPHTVLFVTHDLREAIALADRIVFLTSAPMQTLNEVVVPFSRSERQNQQLIEQFRHDLLQTDGRLET